MTYATDNTTKQALDTFRRFDVDTQLALLWFGYLDLKDQLQPGAGVSVTEPAHALYDRVRALSPEEQLQAQRDIIAGKNNQFTQAYNALASSGQIQFWLYLAQGMEEGSIIQVPQNYKLPSETDQFVNMIKQLDFEQRINFTRSAVSAMATTQDSWNPETQGRTN